jgi:hypothetical protein
MISAFARTRDFNLTQGKESDDQKTAIQLTHSGFPRGIVSRDQGVA